MKGKTTFGQVRLLIGIVSQEFILSEQVRSISEVTIKTHPLKLAKVIPAIFIKELLESM